MNLSAECTVHDSWGEEMHAEVAFSYYNGYIYPEYVYADVCWFQWSYGVYMMIEKNWLITLILSIVLTCMQAYIVRTLSALDDLS